MPIPLKAYAEPSKSELPLDEVAIFALSLPDIIKYKREKRLLIARGSSSSLSRQSHGVPLSIFRKTNVSTERSSFRSNKRQIACPKRFDPQRQRLISQKSPGQSVDLYRNTRWLLCLS